MPAHTVCCIVWCRNSSRKTQVEGVKFYALPQSFEIARKWKEWMAQENYPSVKSLKMPYLCTEHFKEVDILPNRKLVKGTVPSIGKKPCVPKETESCENKKAKCTESSISLSQLLQESEPVYRCFSLSSPHSPVTLCNKENNPSVSNPSVEFSTDTAITLTYCLQSDVSESKPFKIPDETLDTKSIILDSVPPLCSPASGTLAISKPAENNHSQVERVQTPTKSPCSNHRGKRYLGDLSPSDFSTPESAAKNLALAKRTCNLLRKKLKVEHNKRYRLEKKVLSLEKLVKQLKSDKRLIQEKAALEPQG